ncbi:MAG: site-specific integrase [Pseudodesulfovibrio sp.]|nr:site-specific integrase [Pseudodesulfovibrio sp.]
MPYLDKKSGKYRAQKMIDGRRRSKLFASKVSAKKWEAQQTEEAWVAEQQALALHSLLEWSVEYLEYSKQRHAPKTYKGEKVPAFNRLFEAVHHGLLVEDLTVTHCMKMLKSQAEKRSGNAANKDRKNLGAAWNWGVKYLGMPKDNPFTAVEPFPVELQPRYVPPEADFWKVHAVARPKDQLFLLTMLHTGARLGEILKLTWDDLDLESGTITLWTRKRAGGSLEHDLLMLTTRLRKELVEHSKDVMGKYVFCREDGSRYTSRQHLMGTLCKRAKVKRFTFHGIRHLTASILAKEGVDIPNIQAILRHSNSMTTTRYIHRLGITDNVLENVFGG